MSKQFDATIKYLVESHPADWLAYAGLPSGGAVEVVDADISSVTTAADKVIRVNGPAPYVAHLEFQSGPDPSFDRRMLLYNVLLRWRHELPVRTVAVLLHPRAQTPGLSGRVLDEGDGSSRLDFQYRLVRVWQQPVETLLYGPIGTVPLVTLAPMNEAELSATLDRVAERLKQELPAEAGRDAWTAAFILGGLRYDKEVLAHLMTRVWHMEESSTYQWILEKGVMQGRDRWTAEARRADIVKLGRKHFGPPSPAILAKLDAETDLRRLDAIFDRALDAAHWEEIFEPQH